MKQIHQIVKLPVNPYMETYFSLDCAFFDIETTGFSPKNSFVYLIGLGIRDKHNLHIYQFLAQNRNEEEAILTTFLKKLESIHTLITFNGLGFDVPFLKARQLSYAIPDTWDSYKHIDLYKITGKLSHLFRLPNKKQKSLELFLGINREDTYTGGELISTYYEYEKKQDSYNESLLLLHNYEDVLGMTELLPLLSYRDLFTQTSHVINQTLSSYRPYGADTDEQELILELEVKTAFPKPFLYQGKLCALKCEGFMAKLQIKLYHGELKFYYDNPKDYYYLPEEDIAIHKSVASFVDTSHRKKATASTCYTKKSGTFLPQTDALFSPCFYQEKKSPVSYFEFTEDFLSNSQNLDLYAFHLLKSCI